MVYGKKDYWLKLRFTKVGNDYHYRVNTNIQWFSKDHFHIRWCNEDYTPLVGFINIYISDPLPAVPLTGREKEYLLEQVEKYFKQDKDDPELWWLKAANYPYLDRTAQEYLKVKKTYKKR
nr:MAG TPA: hypothetical protein [Caudoviricetes sp.]